MAPAKGRFYPSLELVPSTPLPRHSALEREAQLRGLPPNPPKDPFASTFDKSDNYEMMLTEEFKAANHHPKVPGELNRKPHRLVQGLKSFGTKLMGEGRGKSNTEGTEFRLSFGMIGGEMYRSGTTFRISENEVKFYEKGDKFLASFMISNAVRGKVSFLFRLETGIDHVVYTGWQKMAC